MNIFLLINESKDINLKFTYKLVNYLVDKNNNIILEDIIQSKLNLGTKASKFNLHNIDFALVLGGDGTILTFSHQYYDYDFPLLGINLGRVGCLTEGTPNNAFEIIDKVLEGKYKIETRITIEGEINYFNKKPSNKFNSFNDVSLTRGARLKMLNLDIKVNNNNDTNFYADGVLVATPTGSSAYNLSCGGPLLIPTANNFVITPISAQLKTITSLVVSSDDSISISINAPLQGEDYSINKAILSIDGYESFNLMPNDSISIHKSKKLLRIMKVNLCSSLYDPIYKVTNAIY